MTTERSATEREHLAVAITQADKISLQMPAEGAAGKPWFYILSADQVTVILKALQSAAPQVPHGVCRADDPNLEAPGIGVSGRAASAGDTTPTDRSARGVAPSVSDDSAGTRIPADAAAVLDEIEDFLDNQQDVVDGSYGEPRPNRAMSLLAELREARSLRSETARITQDGEASAPNIAGNLSEIKPDGRERRSGDVDSEGRRGQGGAHCDELRAGGAECGPRTAGGAADEEEWLTRTRGESPAESVRSAERVAINNDLTRWIDKMHDAVLDTDASGRPVGNLFQVWWGLKTEIEKLASSAPSSEARTSGRLSRDSLIDDIVKRDEIIDRLERELAEAKRDRDTFADDCRQRDERIERLVRSANAAMSSGPHYDPSPLMKFYGVDSIPALIDAQAEHVKRLQEQLPNLRDNEPRNHRRG